jgi:hypothetical protein
MFESHAFRSFTVMIITVIFSFSYCYWVCERSAGGKHATYSGAIWTVVLTLPTGFDSFFICLFVCLFCFRQYAADLLLQLVMEIL